MESVVPPHLHIGLAEFLVVSAYIILFGALWRLLALRMGDKPISRAMLLVY